MIIEAMGIQFCLRKGSDCSARTCQLQLAATCRQCYCLVQLALTATVCQLCVCVCACACVRACVRACVCVCVLLGGSVKLVCTSECPL